MPKINYASSFLTLIPIVYSITYWVWSIVQLTPAEKVFFGLKTKFNISLFYLFIIFIAVTVFLIMFSYVLWLSPKSIFSKKADNNTWGLFWLSMSYILSLSFVAIASSKQKTNISIYYNGQNYHYLNRINKEIITATTETDNKIMTHLIPVKDLVEEKHNYLITDTKTYLPKSWLIGFSIGMGLIISFYCIAILYMFFKSLNCIWKYIVPIIIFVVTSFGFYLAYPNSRLENKK